MAGANSNLPDMGNHIEFNNPIQVHFCLMSDYGTRIEVEWPNAGCRRTLTPSQFNVIARGQDIVNRKAWVVLEMELELAESLKPPRDGVERIQQEVVEWISSVRPDRTAANAYDKLIEEVEELKESELLDPLEFADVLILVLDLAHMADIDIVSAVRHKLAINRKRRWAVDDKGILNHVGS